MRLSDFFPKDCILQDASFGALCLSNSTEIHQALSFLEDERFLSELNENPGICAVLCNPTLVGALSEHFAGVVLSENPRRDYFQLHNRLALESGYSQLQKESIIGANCQISPLASVAPYGVELEDNVVVEEFVVIKGPCRIGSGSIIHAGVKVGGDGFEFKDFGDTVLDIAHCGGVQIEKNVVIWENTTIHKAVYPWDNTVVGEFCRVGANSHLDHGVKLGSHTKVCAGAVISGRTEVGARAYIGPGAILSNRLRLGDWARVSLGGVVTKDVPKGETVSGNFAIAHEKHIATLRKLRE